MTSACKGKAIRIEGTPIFLLWSHNVEYETASSTASSIKVNLVRIAFEASLKYAFMQIFCWGP